MNDLLIVNEEVTEALADKKPIVALESTIISHPETFFIDRYNKYN